MRQKILLTLAPFHEDSLFPTDQLLIPFQNSLQLFYGQRIVLEAQPLSHSFLTTASTTTATTTATTTTTIEEETQSQQCCHNCGKYATTNNTTDSNRSSSTIKLKKCSQCSYAKYCSIQCQKEHWIFHKLTCSILKSK